MQLTIFKEAHFGFMSHRIAALALSVILILVSFIAMGARGFNLGLDFTGGTLLEVGYQDAMDLGQVRQTLDEAGFGGATVQHFGTLQDVIIRIAPQPGQGEETSAQLSDRMFDALNTAAGGTAELRRVEYVGPQMGEELTEDGGLAVLYSMIGILIYVALRFEWRFAVASVAALVHDVIITLGVFALFQVEFDLPVVAAILAVIGYSLNDTIVVFDRIRENFRKARKGDALTIIDQSINDTLSRTTMTSFTTLLVLMALFIFGGSIIHSFALALIVGIFIGTYSSIFIASVLVAMMGISRADLALVKKEGERIQD
jgi:preprotein translocase subunit SecF